MLGFSPLTTIWNGLRPNDAGGSVEIWPEARTIWRTVLMVLTYRTDWSGLKARYRGSTAADVPKPSTLPAAPLPTRVVVVIVLSTTARIR